MLSRFLSKPSSLRVFKTLISSKPLPSPNHHVPPLKFSTRFFSSDDNWNSSNPNDSKFDSLFESGAGGSFGNADDEWATADGYKQWTIGDDDDKSKDVFDLGESELAVTDGGGGDIDGLQEVESKEDIAKKEEEVRLLEKEEKELIPVLQGPNRAFGDLVAASGITDEMLDNLFLLKDFSGIQGLPPLHVIEDMRYEKATKKSSRADVERQKQEEISKARVRQVDEKGRSYGTGRRKCSVARVWVQPGDGNFLVNDKQFDVYFPVLDQRAALLRPFSETKILGLWDVNCTVKGGGVSGQVGAIRLGISRALQNWEPGLRPALKAAGFMTRDPRVVERKKPGKAKARKSFQWVKR